MKEFRKLKSLKFLYEVNEDGIVRNVKSKKVVDGYREKNGYIRVRFENKCLGKVVRTTVHRLVAEAFLPNPDNLEEVNHIDSNRANNHVSNLEWVSHSDNMKHAYIHDRMPHLERMHEMSRKPVTNGIDTFDSIITDTKNITNISDCFIMISFQFNLLIDKIRNNSSLF